MNGGVPQIVRGMEFPACVQASGFHCFRARGEGRLQAAHIVCERWWSVTCSVLGGACNCVYLGEADASVFATLQAPSGVGDAAQLPCWLFFLHRCACEAVL